MEQDREVELLLNMMLTEVYDCDSIIPPCKPEGDIIDDFNKRCAKYINILETFKKQNKTRLKTDLLLKRVKRIQEGITISLQDFLAGDIKKAYDNFEETFSDPLINKHIQRITIPLKDICNIQQPLYRVRKSERPLIDREDIFHIPFSKRHLVSAQRYSVAGLPCLYLGSSLYVCWQEMNKPDFDKLYISSFITRDNKTKVLNFAPHLKISFSSKVKNEDEVIENNFIKSSYLVLWPLILSCSYIKSHESSSFTQEYIIPNLLMQWISRRSQSPISGIAYSSTRMKKSRESKLSINVVFPPKATYRQTIQNDYCPRLSSLFEFTPPVSWQVLKTLEYQTKSEPTPEQEKAVRFLDRKERFTGIRDFDSEIIRLYPLTDFYKLEVCMDRLFDYSTFL
ncbi:hypothetical protein [Atlantibacter hermannii]|uniref:hypothetical protein n=1 Tax=Atlantibacter hermannii TaxID=565 RepID=UPI002FDDA31E